MQLPEGRYRVPSSIDSTDVREIHWRFEAMEVEMLRLQNRSLQQERDMAEQNLHLRILELTSEKDRRLVELQAEVSQLRAALNASEARTDELSKEIGEVVKLRAPPGTPAAADVSTPSDPQQRSPCWPGKALDVHIKTALVPMHRQEVQSELMMEDPQSIIVLRNVVKLVRLHGKQSVKFIILHFDHIGRKVKKVLLHSHPEISQWGVRRNRLPSVAWVVFYSPDDAAEVLAMPSDHEIRGAVIRVERYSPLNAQWCHENPTFFEDQGLSSPGHSIWGDTRWSSAFHPHQTSWVQDPQDAFTQTSFPSQTWSW